jgi:hypothetical protein
VAVNVFVGVFVRVKVLVGTVGVLVYVRVGVFVIVGLSVGV